MIIQSSNKPIILIFDETIEEQNIRATLWNMNTKLKEWTKDDMTFEDNKISLPLTQEETKEFPKGRVKLEVKWLDNDNIVNFAEEIHLVVSDRQDNLPIEKEESDVQS